MVNYLFGYWETKSVSCCVPNNTHFHMPPPIFPSVCPHMTSPMSPHHVTKKEFFGRKKNASMATMGHFNSEAFNEKMTGEICVLLQPWWVLNHSSLWHWIISSHLLIMIPLLQNFRLKVLLHEFSMLGNQTEAFDAFQAAAEDFRDELCWSNIFTNFLLSAPPASCTNASGTGMSPAPTMQAWWLSWYENLSFCPPK